MNLLEENVGVNLHKLGLGRSYLMQYQKHKQQNEEQVKWMSSNLKLSKEIMKKVRDISQKGRECLQIIFLLRTSIWELVKFHN